MSVAQDDYGTWNGAESRIDDHDAYVYTHDTTGVRVACIHLPINDLWIVDVYPPERAGDNSLLRINGYHDTADAAEYAAKEWMADHPEGVPETYNQETGEWRVGR